MNKKIIITLIAALLFIAIFAGLMARHIPPKTLTSTQINNALSSEWANSKNDLGKVKTSVLFENIIDGPPLGPQRSTGEIIQLLKETNASMVFRGFWRWLPPPDSPDNIPLELASYLAERAKISPGQVPELVDKSGYNYKELNSRISAIKKEIPGITFVGAIPAQRISRIDKNDITGKIYRANETWAMALDPGKWNLTQNGKALTKEEFQKQYALMNGWIKPGETYDFNKVEAYFPDITNPDFQEILVSWAEKQIDSGADVIWIDGLPQTQLVYLLIKDANHPAIKDLNSAAKNIIDEIHKYGESKGKRIYVGSWGVPPSNFVEGLPYLPPNIDFVTMTPTESEVQNKKLDESYAKISSIRNLYPNTPIFVFIDWGFASSPTVTFSQKLDKAGQEAALISLDDSFAKVGVNFVYPVHGGYMGAGAATKMLSYGKYRTYDSLAPEFDTYQIIRELANNKSRVD
jgi:hypothetical protein